MTNEQMVMTARQEVLKLKSKYLSFFQKITLSNTQFTQEDLLKCHNLGLEYFNYFETFVADSGLLKAHEHGFWITSLAEDCYSILSLYSDHVIFMRENLKCFIEPDQTAFANMQRVIKKYLPSKQCKDIKNLFTINNLPIQGFQYKEANNMPKEEPMWKTITAIAIGVAFIICVFIAIIIVPNPTPAQFFVFRLLLALASAGIAACIPGFLSVESQFRKFSIRATGAIAVFVIVWNINPPALL